MLNDAEILVQPDHDVSFNATIREALEALERIPERFAARYDRVDIQLAPARRKAEVLGKSACEQALSDATLCLAVYKSKWKLLDRGKEKHHDEVDSS